MAEKIDFVSVGYVLGILSIVFAFVSPVAGVVLGIIGLIQSKRHGISRIKKMNIAGIVLGLVFFIIEIIALFYSANSGLGSLFPAA